MKFYIYKVHRKSRTYRGSIWDRPSIPYVPNDAKQLCSFEIDNKSDNSYMIISEDELKDHIEYKEKGK